MRIARARSISTKGLFLGLALAPGILGVASAAVDGLVGRYRLHSTAVELAAHLERARSEAISENLVVRIRRDGNQLIREHSADGVTFVREAVLLTLPSGVRVSVSPKAPAATLTASGTR